MKPQAPVILLVDDDREFLDSSRAILEADGYRVIGVGGADEALQRLHEEKPNLIITDVMMGTLDRGFSLARQVRNDPRLNDVPIVILTGIGRQLGYDFTPRTDEDLAAVAADAVLEKPVAPAVLLQKVRALLPRGGFTLKVPPEGPVA